MQFALSDVVAVPLQQFVRMVDIRSRMPAIDSEHRPVSVNESIINIIFVAVVTVMACFNFIDTARPWIFRWRVYRLPLERRFKL